MGRAFIFGIVVFIIISQPGLTDIPQTMSYQGLLTDLSGNPLNGNYNLIFRLYSTEMGAPALWTEPHPSVVVTKGIFNVILGSITPLNLPFDTQYWLSIQVGAGTELTPRLKLTSSAYSLNARSVSDGAITSAKIASGQVVKSLNNLKDNVTLAPGANITITPSGQTLTIAATGTALPDGAVTTPKLADNAVTSAKIQNGAIATDDLADNAVTINKIQPNVVSSVDGVSNDGSNIDLVQQNAITITPSDAADTITIGENHSGKTDNPHNTTATQTGALVSVEGVSNAGGNIDLVPGSNITIIPNDGANTITISASGGSGWSLTGNSGTTPGTNFLGTTDNVPLELKVNNARILRLVPSTISPNIIGGYNGNSVTSGAYGATISGGGVDGSLNRVTDNYGTIDGGNNNQAGDGGTTGDKPYATVGGGSSNKATGSCSTVGGGQSNEATDYLSTVGGGWGNDAQGESSTIAGGEDNDATGNYSTIPGGNKNLASGQYSFAAGRRAKANHTGAFVWGDSTDADVASTMANQFVVRANGGVHFRDSQEMRMSDTADVMLVLEADTNNINEDDNPGILFSQDGGAVEGFLGYKENTNKLLLENRYPDRLELKSSGGIYLHTNNAQTKGMHLFDDSTVGGGESNEATGDWATVPGGRNNSALGDYSFAAGRNATAEDNGTFVWADSSENNIIVVGENRFVVRASGGVSLYTNSTFSAGMYLPAGGFGWVAVSDRVMKENIRPVDVREVLNRLSRVPISQWSYKTQDPSIEHIGPMAQDFHQAFGLGEDDKGINSIDADGVALAAIQGLYEIVKEKEAENSALQHQVDELEARLAALEKLITTSVK